MTVYIGKSEDVRTDSSFVELTVGDPEVADVNPLTDRSLSILGKKNGTTRVSAYGEGKKLIGVFDVEVVYDTSLLQHRDSAPLPARQSAGLGGQRPHHALRHRAGRPDRRQGGVDRQAVRPRRHQLGRRAAPQQVMLEVRFVEATRQAGRDLGVQWNVFGQQHARQYRQSHAERQLPVTNRPAAIFAAGRRRRRQNIGTSASHLAGRRGRSCCRARRRSA